MVQAVALHKQPANFQFDLESDLQLFHLQELQAIYKVIIPN